MKTSDIRSAFLDFFESKAHAKVPSSSLVPANDPTLLFTNAGMVQFKDTFLGREPRAYTMATSSQRCVRAGGKHNDLENVGYTARHHTFFEMLGNFSFGEYFKREAIAYAWEFLTKELNLPEERLWVTVYKDDKEAEDIWLNEMGISADRFSRLGDADNFWSMGDTGPCGPCSEIFYDHGEDVAGDPPGGPNDDGDRYIEIWNMVFMQYNRTADGKQTDLPKPSIDTGMGLERIAAIMQGVHSNYEIDIFQSLLKSTSALLGGVSLEEKSLRVIADHIRSCAFLIADGVMPSNEGRGYTLRRIIRRAVRHGNKLGAKGAFFHKLVAPLVEVMEEAAAELKSKQQLVTDVLLKEEQQFAKTLDKGMKVLEDAVAAMQGTQLSGETIFTLYDTYGFPIDLTNDIARERELSLDMAGYEAAMEAQRERARASSKFGIDYNTAIEVDGQTEFTGYSALTGTSRVREIFVDGASVEQLEAGQQALLVLDETPFYAESGGQAGDLGQMQWEGGSIQVVDTKKEGDNHLHLVSLKAGLLSKNARVEAQVDQATRQASRCNHSATHLLHAALQQVLGEHVTQKGSLVDADKLRFDFSHNEPVSAEQLRQIEGIVNAHIRGNSPVTTEICDMDTARAKGAMALFGEKYGDTVRLLSMGNDNFSVELCGGTHVERTGDIGAFVITQESGIAAGVRRIEALTAVPASAWLEGNGQCLSELAGLVKGTRDSVAEKVQGLLARNRQLEKELEQIKQKLAAARGSDLVSEALDLDGIKLLATELEGVEPKALRDMVDQLKNKLGSAVVVLATQSEGKVSLAVGVTQDLTKQLRAGDLMKHLAPIVGGKGGGRPDFAQGGGTDAAAITTALQAVQPWLSTNR